MPDEESGGSSSYWNGWGAVPDEESGGSSSYWNGRGQCLMKNLEVLPRIGMLLHTDGAYGLHILQSSTSTKYKYEQCSKEICQKIEYDVFLSTLCITIAHPHTYMYTDQ